MLRRELDFVVLAFDATQDHFKTSGLRLCKYELQISSPEKQVKPEKTQSYKYILSVVLALRC